MKIAEFFFKLGNYISVCQSFATMVGNKNFLVQPVESWKMSSWERNISEQKVIQYT